MQRESNTQLTPTPVAPEWLAQPERSQGFIIRAMVWLALTAGRRWARLLLHPISAYFLMFSVEARQSSRDYLRRVLGREPRLADVYRHYHTFSATILDRVYLMKGDYSAFDVHTYGESLARSLVDAGKGGFLLGGHLGSFEVIRALGREQSQEMRVRMVMYEENARKINEALDAINPALSRDIIGLGKVDSMLRVDRALGRGEFVGMLADRTIKGEGTVPVTFFGEPTRMPIGPFRMAVIMKRPIVLIFGLYRGGNRYDIHFEELADLSAVPRGQRDAAINDAVQKYASRLEHFCRLAPYNWFNFYDYWR